MKGEIVVVRPVWAIKLAGHRLSGTKSCERRTCPLPSGSRNPVGGSSSVRFEVARNEGLSSSIRYEDQASETLTVRYEVARMEGLSSSVWYEESSTHDFVRPVRSHVNRDLDHVCPLRGIKQAGLRQSATKSSGRKACPLPSHTRNQAGGTLSVWYEVVL